VAFSPDGRRLVTADWADRVRVFDCGICGSVDDLLRMARARAGRGLTPTERSAYLGSDGG
ncbi:MAG TPA: WD40 repeat domain-containing protein, partial [Candidatus Limnocylindrales bacterium]|nr:WD40 repeat domain-containing protein [Candidatus Limnocylindrales bacterium]